MLEPPYTVPGMFVVGLTIVLVVAARGVLEDISSEHALKARGEEGVLNLLCWQWPIRKRQRLDRRDGAS